MVILIVTRKDYGTSHIDDTEGGASHVHESTSALCVTSHTRPSSYEWGQTATDSARLVYFLTHWTSAYKR